MARQNGFAKAGSAEMVGAKVEWLAKVAVP